jgi:hypothetical protein
VPYTQHIPGIVVFTLFCKGHRNNKDPLKFFYFIFSLYTPKDPDDSDGFTLDMAKNMPKSLYIIISVCFNDTQGI